MKKVTKPLSPEAFEAVCSIWEQHINEFIVQLSDGSIPTLRKSVFLYVNQIRMERKNAAHAGHISAHSPH